MKGNSFPENSKNGVPREHGPRLWKWSWYALVESLPQREPSWERAVALEAQIQWLLKLLPLLKIFCECL